MRKAIFLLFFGGLFGKALGFVRELLLATYFGTSVIIDTYRAAFVGIFIPMNFFTSDALNAGFIPLYRRYREEDNDQRHLLFWSLNLVLAVISVGVASLIFFGAETWTGLLVPGFQGEAHGLTVRFLKIMALGIPFYVQASMASYLEMGNGIYGQYSLRASVQSVALIIGTIAAFYLKQPMYLAWSFTICYAFLCLGGWSYLYYKGLLLWPRQWTLADLRPIRTEFLKILTPLLPLPVFLQLNFALERAVSSLIGPGIVASLDYAKIVTDTGVLLIAVPIGLAGLSHLSGLESSEVRNRVTRMVPLLLMLFIPASAMIFAHSTTIVRIVFARGAFGAESVRTTSVILSGLAIGFWAQATGYVLIKVLNAQLRNRDVLVFSIAGLLLSILFNLSMFRYLGFACLGIAASLNGLLVFVLAVRAFSLWHAIRIELLRLSAGVAGYVLLIKFLLSSIKLPDWFELTIGALYWLIYSQLVTAYRIRLRALFLEHFSRKSPA